jgi:phage I-like protein
MNTVSIALNFQIPSNGLPEWLPLIPAGDFRGRDGRSWTNDQPDKVIAYNNQLQRHIVVDLEHASEIKAPAGEPAPSQAWIEELENRSGEIWGRVNWTEHGGQRILNREYIYYSPALLHDKSGRVIGIASVGLTNKHNLHLPALNHQEDNTMTLADILTALGLASTATAEDAVVEIKSLNSEKQQLQLSLNQARSALPDAEKFVPVKTHQLALNRAQEAESKLKKVEDDTTESFIEQAIRDKRIAPKDKEHYMSLCQQGGFESVKALVANAAVIISDDTDLDDKKPNTKNNHGLTEIELSVCSQLGQTPEEFAKAKSQN